MKKSSTAIVVIGLTVLVASANAQQAGEPASRIQIPTRFEPMQQSLEALLNEGWTIVSGSPTFTGVALRSGSKWAFCGVSENRGPGRTRLSECYALN